MSDWTYITAAYVVTWLMLVGYGTYLSARRRALVRAERERELELPYRGER